MTSGEHRLAMLAGRQLAALDGSVELREPGWSRLFVARHFPLRCRPDGHTYWGGPKSCCFRRTQSLAPSAASGSTR